MVLQVHLLVGLEGFVFVKDILTVPASPRAGDVTHLVIAQVTLVLEDAMAKLAFVRIRVAAFVVDLHLVRGKHPRADAAGVQLASFRRDAFVRF